MTKSKKYVCDTCGKSNAPIIDARIGCNPSPAHVCYSPSRLEKFLKKPGVKKDLRESLSIIVKDCKDAMRADKAEFTEEGCDGPSIDLRLCIDPNQFNGYGFDWIFRTGDSSYDPRHSTFCAASYIGLNTNKRELFTELIDDILDQDAQHREVLVFAYGQETELPQDIIDEAPKMGPFDAYGAGIMQRFDIQVSQEDAVKYLRSLGAWSVDELLCLEVNKERLLWIAVMDCKENKTNYWYMGEQKNESYY